MTKAFLGVENSVTGKRWVERPYDERMALALSQRYEMPDALARSLSARGLDLDNAPDFLDPKLRELMPDPSLFLDMDKAADRFACAVQKGQKIAVFGDYDVDGATSTALLVRFARAVGSAPLIYIPDRLKEGYGPNPEAMRKLATAGVKLVICVDCGTTAHEAMAAAKEAGLDVIILDHHTAEPILPPCVALVNPNRLDETQSAKFGTLAAVGVTYLFVVAANRRMRALNWFVGSRPQPDLRSWLDLVALGTVCDVVKLTGLNRAYVTQGLKILSSRQNVGLVALADAAGAKGPSDAYTLGFVLGPRVNAGGRVGESDLGAKLLACDDPVEAMAFADKLNTYNTERRDLEASILAQVDLMTFDEKAPLVFVASENWHPGVIGIVASRLKEKFNRPTLVMALTGDVGKGSGRSIGTIDLGANIIAARQAGLLIHGGGHKMAAGFTVAKDKMQDFHAFMNERIGKQIEAEPIVPTLSIDALVSAGGLNADFMEKKEVLAPFGTGNPEPRFALADVKIIKADVVGGKHVSLILMQGSTRLRAIAFRAAETQMAATLMGAVGHLCHIAGHIRPDTWRGDDAVQCLVDDVALV